MFQIPFSNPIPPPQSKFLAKFQIQFLQIEFFFAKLFFLLFSFPRFLFPFFPFSPFPFPFLFSFFNLQPSSFLPVVYSAPKIFAADSSPGPSAPRRMLGFPLLAALPPCACVPPPWLRPYQLRTCSVPPHRSLDSRCSSCDAACSACSAPHVANLPCTQPRRMLPIQPPRVPPVPLAPLRPEPTIATPHALPILCSSLPLFLLYLSWRNSSFLSLAPLPLLFPFLPHWNRAEAPFLPQVWPERHLPRPSHSVHHSVPPPTSPCAPRHPHLPPRVSPLLSHPPRRIRSFSAADRSSFLRAFCHRC